jgi:hypothetical protein
MIMNKRLKTGLLAAAVMLILYVGSGMFVTMNGIDPQEIDELNLAKDWFIYRLMFYAVIVGSWPKISELIGYRRKQVNPDLEDEKVAADVEYLKKQRWKVAVIFLFFEIAAVQKFGV